MRASRLRPIALSLLIATAAGFVYWNATHYEFVNYDDYHYVVEHGHVTAGLSLDGIRWALTAFAAGNWHPLTWMSHQLDCTLFGLNPAGHHLVNVILHALTAIFLYFACVSLTARPWRSLIVALLFAVHPLNVESVAWISERKSILSMLFWVLTLWAYAGYVRRPRALRYIVVFCFCALSLMSKPMAITLPCVLLLLDFWPLGRWRWDEPNALDGAIALVKEKAPLFALAIAAGTLTVAAQGGAGAVAPLYAVPFAARILNALTSYSAYLGKAIWPSKLAVFYPHRGLSVNPAEWILSALILTAISALVWRERRRGYGIVGWLWYLGTLVPVIGIIQVGSQAMADRYAYVPLLGVFVAVVWRVADMVEHARWSRAVLASATALSLAALAVTARRQADHWSNSIALFEHARDVTRHNHVAYTNLGLAYNKQKRWDEAIIHFKRAIAVQPQSAEAYGHLGIALAKKGRTDEAVQALLRALEIYPKSMLAHNNLGVALRTRDPARALSHLRKAITLDPEFSEAYVNLGAVLLTRQSRVEAEQAFATAMEKDPGSAATPFRIGSVWLEQGDLRAADTWLRKALSIDPRHADAHNSLGVTLLRAHKLPEAIVEFQEALRLEPQHADARSNWGTALTRLGKLAEGQSHLEQALALQPSHADAHTTLGACLAQQGRLTEAIPHFRQALEVNPDHDVALSNLGAALIQQRRLTEARDALLRAVAIRPSNADAQCNLGVAFLLLGDRAEARRHFQAALASAPGHSNARQQLAALERGTTARR